MHPHASNLLAMPETRWLTRVEAAQYLRLSERYVALETSRGSIPASKVGRRVLYDVEDLNAYMRSKRMQPGEEVPDTE